MGVRVFAGVVVAAISVGILVATATPAIASICGISPSAVASGSGDTTVTVTGYFDNFTLPVRLTVNGQPMVGTDWTGALWCGESFTATIPASLLATDQTLSLGTVDANGQYQPEPGVVFTVGAGGNVQGGLTMDQWHTIVFSLLGGLGAWVFIAGVGRPW